jgi:hypothetical protein
MKRKNLLFLAIAFLATFSLASCLNDDYESKAKLPSAEELKAASKLIQGSYQGKIYQYGLNDRTGKSEKKDSVNSSWEIKDDSTLVIRNFPSRMLAANIKDSVLRKTIAALPDQEIKCAIGVYSVKPILFLAAPYAINLGKMTYKGQLHDISIHFRFEPTFTYGGYDTESKTSACRLRGILVYVDGVFEDLATSPLTTFLIYSKPRV